jgi:hypothetical protein
MSMYMQLVEFGERLGNQVHFCGTRENPSRWDAALDLLCFNEVVC